MNIRSIFILSIIFLLTSCSFFEEDKDPRKIAASGLSPKALYDLAQDRVKSGSIEKAIEEYELILAAYPGSKYAIQARLDMAYNLYKQKKYMRAINELDKFIKKYPNIKSTPYAYYLRGVIAEAKSTSILDNLITDSAQRDVKSVSDAYFYYLELIEAYPDSTYSIDAATKLVKLKNTLARHEFYVAIYYTEIGSYIAAINRCKFVIENYSNSASIPDILNLMAYNYDQINANELAADTRKILISSYPNYTSKYSIN